MWVRQCVPCDITGRDVDKYLLRERELIILGKLNGSTSESSQHLIRIFMQSSLFLVQNLQLTINVGGNLVPQNEWIWLLIFYNKLLLNRF
jgi:hypothetical protein